MKKSTEYVRGIIVLIGTGLFVFLILSMSGYVNFQAESIPNESGSTSNVVVKTCVPSVPIPSNPVGSALCGTIPLNSTSLNQQNTLICSNGGVPVNGVCPVSVKPLPDNLVVNNTITTPVQSKESLQIIPYVTITDNSGKSSVLPSDPTNLFLQSFIAISGTNTPFDHGIIDLKIKIQASPNEIINANGTLWLAVNGMNQHPSGLLWSANGITDDSGMLFAKIQIPTGVVPSYVFDVSQKISLITKNTNQLNFTLSNIKIQNGKNQSYVSVMMKNFYVVSLDYDPYLILSKNSQGQYVRVYPSDDVATIQSNFVRENFQSYAYKKGFPSGIVYTFIYHTPKPAGSMQVYKSTVNGDVLLGTTSSVSGLGKDCSNSALNNIPDDNCFASSLQQVGIKNGYDSIQNIPRDSDITVKITGGSSPTVKTFHTPPDSVNYYNYICTYQGCSFTITHP